LQPAGRPQCGSARTFSRARANAEAEALKVTHHFYLMGA
jgi:hypothetical protein